MPKLEMSLFYVLTHSFSLNEMYQCPEDMDMTRIERPYIGTYFFVSGVFLMVSYFQRENESLLSFWENVQKCSKFHIGSLMGYCRITVFLEKI